MFEFLMDQGNYSDRKVDRYNGEEGVMVSTAAVSDGREPFETAVQHPDYNEGKMVIVECYATKELAQVGHDKWQERVEKETLPKVLTDCQNSEVSQFCDPDSLIFEGR